MPPQRRSPFVVGSMFAAIGGFCRAFEQGGAKVAWANENDRFAIETFKLNFPHIRCIGKDVQDFSVHGDNLEPVDILTAGFPCQPFSVAGEKRGFLDERGLLFLHIIRIIQEFGKNKPKILLLENVKNLKSHDKGRTFKRIQFEIQRAGYWFGENNTQFSSACTDSLAGTYVVNADGTGTATITANNTAGGCGNETDSFALVISSGGNLVNVVLTTPARKAISYGVLYKQ